MNDPTDGDPDLHFSGVGSAAPAQKHTEDIGIINDLELLPVQIGLETADGGENVKFWGLFLSISPDEILGSVFKASRRKCFSTTRFSCGSCSTA